MFEKKIIKNIPRNKKAFSAITLLLILAISTMTFSLPSFAQVGVPQPEKTVGYISVAPTLTGVGQNATVNLWLFPLPSDYLYGPYYLGFQGVTVTFTKPDGTKDTFMPEDGSGHFAPGQVSSLGSMFFFYSPDKAGNWSVSFTMPAQNITNYAGTVLYTGCTSNTAYFTVQTDPVLAGLLNGYPWSQLPNDNTFWDYPINSNNREWSTISGYWNGYTDFFPAVRGIGTNLWQPYGSGPNTGHIVWSQPYTSGGLVGGAYGGISYGNPNGAVPNPIILDGKVFINMPNSGGKFECIDETTGKVLYTATGSISMGVHIPGDANSQAGFDFAGDKPPVLASSYGNQPTTYLLGFSGNTMNFYNPLNGVLMRSISNASVSNAFGMSMLGFVDGTNLAYVAVNGNLTAWDLSKVKNNNWPTGITWTRELPTSILTGTTSLLATPPGVFGYSTDASTIVINGWNQYWGYSAKDGASLWNLTLNYAISGNQQFVLQGVSDFIVFDPTATTFKCYSMTTGNLLWTSPSMVTSSSPWASTWTLYNARSNDNNNLYLALPDGTIAALSLQTGEQVWRSTSIPSTEYTNNVVPNVMGMVLVGGNVYVYSGYSLYYQLDPIPRFSMMTCVNATTGSITYTLNGGIFPAAAANGYVIGQGMYDGNIYCIGKGQTSTSVTIQNNVVTNHATALITGNVLDQSPASAGTPAVADASMSEWMDYLHMQNATLLNNPPTPQGVTVKLTAVDPNGNTINVGTTTTDSKGNYAINFNPENVGIYTIKVSFAGTNAYFSSDSEAKLSVIAAPEYTPTASASNTGISETTLYTAVGAVIAVVVIFGVLLALLMLRKRP